MSLVNKMLRDLDARRAGSNERGPVPLAVSPLLAEDAGTMRKLGLGVFVVLGLGLAAALQLDLIPLGSTETLDVDTPVKPKVVPVQPAPPTPVDVVQASAPVADTPLPTQDSGENTAVPPEPTFSMPVEAGLRLESQLLSLPVPREPVVATPPKKEAETIRQLEPDEEARPPVKLSPPAAIPTTKPRPVPAQRESDTRIDKQPRRPPAMDRADAEYQQAVQAQHQGNAAEALTRYRRAITDQPGHVAARQALASLLIELSRYDEAELVLRGGTETGTARLGFATMLARLKVERGEIPAALDVLQQQRAVGEKSADYQGFVAALLNRLGRHSEAVQHYQMSTRLSPNEARWWAGLGIALDAEGKSAEARAAYQTAKELPGLSAELLAHIAQRLKSQ